MTDPAPPALLPGALRRTILRLFAVLVIVVVLHQMMDWASTEASQGSGRIAIWMLALFLLVYALLIAVPFVPGVEVGLSLMVMQGPSIAPWIYLATVAGLLLAFSFGEWLPYQRMHRILADLHLRRACRLIERLQLLDRRDRLNLLEQRTPAWARPLVFRFRYIVVALLINLPGSSLIGGGGGLMFLAGFSRLFHFAPMFVTILIAVAPVPFAFWAFGIDLRQLAGS
jgi:hypothetical protein